MICRFQHHLPAVIGEAVIPGKMFYARVIAYGVKPCWGRLVAGGRALS